MGYGRGPQPRAMDRCWSVACQMSGRTATGGEPHRQPAAGGVFTLLGALVCQAVFGKGSARPACSSTAVNKGMIKVSLSGDWWGSWKEAWAPGRKHKFRPLCEHLVSGYGQTLYQSPAAKFPSQPQLHPNPPCPWQNVLPQNRLLGLGTDGLGDSAGKVLRFLEWAGEHYGRLGGAL